MKKMIFLFFLLPILLFSQERDYLYTFSGKITDCKTKNNIADVDINVVCADGQSVTAKSNFQGEYKIQIVSKKATLATIIRTNISSDAYYNSSERHKVVFNDSLNRRDTVISFCLIKNKGCTIFVFPTLIFQKNSIKNYSIIDSDYEISSFAILLLDNPTFVIEIGSHCGFDEDSIKKLDSLRANFIRNELIKFGVAPDRLKIKLYSSAQQKNDKETVAKLKSKEEKEKAMKENRRITFTIVAKNYVSEFAPKDINYRNEE